MSEFKRHRWIGALGLGSLTTACVGDLKEVSVPDPEKLCGTRVDPDLVRPLLESAEELDEYSRVERGQAISAPCLLHAGEEEVLVLFFYWTDTAPKVTEPDYDTSGFQVVRNTEAVSGLGDTAIVGANGAVATTPCRVGDKEHFTLKLFLPQVGPADAGHREDIERFMRAYFPATVKTWNCR